MILIYPVYSDKQPESETRLLNSLRYPFKPDTYLPDELKPVWIK